MTMRQLARKVGAEIGAEEDAEWELSIERGWKPDEALGLSVETTRELLAWAEALDRLVPGDFDYTVTLHEMGYDAVIGFQNGPMAGGGQPFPLELDKSARRKLTTFDWEPFRRDFMELSEAMDAMLPSGPVPEWFKEYLRNGGKP